MARPGGGRLAALALALLAPAGAGASDAPCPEWPLLARYVERFVTADGRVVDRGVGDRTTSEGQAWALFFALAAGDRALFDRVLRWTQDHLAGGDLATRLPAWLWGEADAGRWGVLDGNSASDADLWTAYALLEAGRLWSDARLERLGRAVGANMAAREVAQVPGLGATLLPGASGFRDERARRWRLNPSYLAPPPLRRLASAGVAGPWAAVVRSSERVLRESGPRGAWPDWVSWGPAGPQPDAETRSAGSYDAIRVYLWLGLLGPGDPLLRALPRAGEPLLAPVRTGGALPERIDAASLKSGGVAPPGFHAALLPLSLARRDERAAAALQAALEGRRADGLYGRPPAYYDQNLALFATGFAEGRWRFERDGRLVPKAPACARP